jgi:Relaxase/Mobilisation nuclease domain
MITKATPKGKSFKGIVNYLFNGRLEGREIADKKATIIADSGNLELPRDNQDDEGIKRLIKCFNNQAMSHEDYSHTKTYVGHHIISFSKDDMILLSEKERKEIVEQYISDAGLKNTQYVAVSHEDTDDFHIHIVFNRCMNNRKIYDDWKEKVKASEKAVALNLKYDLPLTGKQKEMAKSSGVWEFRCEHDDTKELAKDPILKDMRNLLHFKKVSEAANRKVVEDEKTIEVDGKKYRKTDLEAVFFKNRRDKAKQEGKKPLKAKYKKDKKDKARPDYMLKNEKYHSQQEEKGKVMHPIFSEEQEDTQNRKKQDTPAKSNPKEQENRQNFNSKNAWQTDEDEFSAKKKRRRKI